tara:strand:- start:1016 stop:1126 length:111 start_codon:yes stop_codon:yes gene_type:complete
MASQGFAEMKYISFEMKLSVVLDFSNYVIMSIFDGR